MIAGEIRAFDGAGGLAVADDHAFLTQRLTMTFTNSRCP